MLAILFALGGCGGDGPSDPQTPAAPQNLQATAGGGEVLLQWTDVAGVDGYTLYHATGGGIQPDNFGIWVSQHDGVMVENVTSPHTVGGLTNGTEYFFVVTATAGGQESAPSNESSAVPAHAAVDGVRSPGEYGPAVSVQTVQTQFGDNFTELNAAYARVSDGTLYLMLTGNLEGNFNKLNVFIDSQAGGQNVINGALNPPNDGWAAAHNGMRFDAGFEPDYLLIMRHGAGKFDLDYAVIGGGPTDFDFFGNVFGGTQQGSATTPSGPNLGHSFMIGFNNSNTAGVTGGIGAADQAAALAVTTGIEIGIPLAAIGNPANGAEVRISAMVNGSSHNYLSNQLLGGLQPPQGNLGGDGFGNFTGGLSGINLNNFPGEQFFTIVIPEPSAGLLLGCN